MKVEDFFNQQNIIDLSFFNFSNAITACYYARDNLEILKVNDNFLGFFPILGNVKMLISRMYWNKLAYRAGRLKNLSETSLKRVQY